MPGDPSIRFHRLLEKLLKVSREDIRDALKPAREPRAEAGDSQPQNDDSGSKSRTNVSSV